MCQTWGQRGSQRGNKFPNVAHIGFTKLTILVFPNGLTVKRWYSLIAGLFNAKCENWGSQERVRKSDASKHGINSGKLKPDKKI